MDHAAAAATAVERLLGPAELAAMLDVPVATIYEWRYRGRGPRACKVGKHLRYRRSDIDAWLESQAD